MAQKKQTFPVVVIVAIFLSWYTPLGAGDDIGIKEKTFVGLISTWTDAQCRLRIDATGDKAGIQRQAQLQ